MSGPLLFLLPSALLHQDKDRVEKMFQEFKRVDTKSCNHKLSPHLDLFSSLNLSIVPVQVKIKEKMTYWTYWRILEPGLFLCHVFTRNYFSHLKAYFGFLSSLFTLELME